MSGKKVIFTKEQIAEAGAIVVKFDEFMRNNPPIIGHEELLPDRKRVIMHSIYLTELSFCRLANHQVKAEGKADESLEADLDRLRILKVNILSYGLIEEADRELVDYFNQYSRLEDVPEAEKADCGRLYAKYLYDVLGEPESELEGYWPKRFGFDY